MALYYEVNKKYIARYGTIEKAIEEGYFIDWTPERIKAAFNAGNGTMKDFKRYMNDNKQFCKYLKWRNQKNL